MARLGDICKFQSGGTPSKNNPLYFGGTIPWITTVALNGSVIDENNAVDRITEKALAESAARIVPANSIMVGTRVGVGKVAINSVPMSTSQDIISLLEIDELKWNKPFLCKWLSAKSDYLQSQARGATIKGIKIETISNLEIPEMPIENQRSISTCLDCVSQLISLRKQQLAKLDELVKARFVEMFGDPVSNPKGWRTPVLSECLSGIENGKSFVCESEPRQGDWPAVLKLSAVTYGLFQPKENKAVLDKEDFVQAAGVKTGDLLFTRKNTPELVGMSAYVFETEPYLMMPDLIFRLNTNEKCDKIFLWQLINHDLFRASISNLASGSAKSMSNISKERLAGLQIICPPVELQQVFAKLVRGVYRQKLTIQQSLDKLEVLKKSLVQEFFG